MERKQFIAAGAAFSAPNPIGAVIYGRIKENATDDLRSIGATKADLESDTAWVIWLKKLLEAKPMIGAWHIFNSLLRPESATSTLDAFESASPEEVMAPINFFIENIKALLPEEPSKDQNSPSARKGKPSRKRKQ